MTEPEINAAFLIASGLGCLAMFFVVRFHRKQRERDAERRAGLAAHAAYEMRRLR